MAAGPPGATLATVTPPALFQSRIAEAPFDLESDPGATHRPVLDDLVRHPSARSIGMANPRPTEPPLLLKIDEFTPTTSPSALVSGPPSCRG